MRIGSVVEIKKYDVMPRIVGEYAEIVDLQMQEVEKYRTYPIWGKILFGAQKGSIYGFQYDEVAEPALVWWEEKTPCWEMLRCPEAIRNECPAFRYRSLPCWEIEGTYSKLYDYGANGDSLDICQMCRVYKRWGQGEAIHIKLFGKGIATSTS
ncbi:hypothetical protein ES705_11877 [subsurface metagenome]